MSDSEAMWSRKDEVASLLAQDETVLGRLWGYELEGLSPQQMAEREGLNTTGWVYNGRNLIRVLRDGHVPSAPTMAEQAARKVRAWLTRLELSPDLRDALVEQEKQLSARAADSKAQDAEIDVAVADSVAAEKANTSGIYVYTLPHYIKHRADEESGRTFLKVGHSARDAFYRARSQGRLTALPEDPILLRIYPADESANMERLFHSWLEDADHSRSRTTRGGSEWFLTSPKFLDRIAASLGLSVIEVTLYDAET
ncbi:GIY-YIG nuclease family protein [Rhodococcus sp. BP22]|uniref:GIY-YIG nuclease family protein n=1 Tax=Rhodococcus sp. BP22 TaxID=2758566 RepID=UPI001644CE25|nr:GIY-YIG nuclease family protein [Rhodococcus sp. BP22]